MFLLIAAALAILLGVAHSYLGERYILMRLFRRSDLPKLFGSDWFTRRTLRFAWHLTTVAFWGLAAILLVVAFDGEVDFERSALIIVSGTFIFSALIAFAATRGRHLSWVVFLLIAMLTLLSARNDAFAPPDPLTTGGPETGHAPVNGVQMYYQVHGGGDGVPLVLLHGGGSTIEVTFGEVLPIFARHRRVIAVEEQGHGRTSDRDAPVAFETSAGDFAALLRYLKVEKADFFGFSNGASVALQVAIRHPELVRKLVFASSFTKRDGVQPQFWEFMDQADFSNMPQPLKDAFLEVNPDQEQLRTMHDKDAARMRSFQDVPDDLVRSVGAPTLIVLGDQDVVTLEHAVELTRLFADARLLILPGGHGDYLGELVTTARDSRYPELTAQLIAEFLEAQ